MAGQELLGICRTESTQAYEAKRDRKEWLTETYYVVSVMRGWNGGSGSHPSEDSPCIACCPLAPEVARLSSIVGGKGSWRRCPEYRLDLELAILCVWLVPEVECNDIWGM